MHGSRTHPRPGSWPSNRFEDGTDLVSACFVVGHRALREFKCDSRVRHVVPRYPAVFRSSAANLAAKIGISPRRWPPVSHACGGRSAPRRHRAWRWLCRMTPKGQRTDLAQQAQVVGVRPALGDVPICGPVACGTSGNALAGRLPTKPRRPPLRDGPEASSSAPLDPGDGAPPCVAQLPGTR